MRYLTVTFLILAMLAPVSVFSQKQKRKKARTAGSKMDLKLEESPVFSKCFTGFALYDPEKGEMLCEYNADKYFTPASNTKILTLYTSLQMLGDSIPALQYQQQGDLLIFWGTGDPSFLNPHLAQNPQVFNFLKNSREQLLFCPANFKDQRYGSGWMWGDFPYAYQAEKSPFPVYSNVAHFRQADSGGPIEVRPKFLKSLLRYDSMMQVEDYIGRDEFDNHFTVNTTAPKGRDVEWHVPFRYSPAFLSEVLTDTLRRPVHVLNANLLPPPNAATLYSLRADTLYRLMMQESDNFIAEQLLLLCSWRSSGAMNTEQVIDFSKKNFLAGLPDEPKWVDGSGLSRYNLVTPRSLVKLLDKIQQQVPRPRLFNIFPAGGVSGTIKTNYRNGGSPYIFAKTGTLRNNHCLSGYLITRKGKMLIFSFMHNNFTVSTSSVRKEMEQVLREIYETM
jgi:serine-type D-Ala-D-Ala carboxypeptidase/endopeptidase (penicillin-binding protein 4)